MCDQCKTTETRPTTGFYIEQISTCMHLIDTTINNTSDGEKWGLGSNHLVMSAKDQDAIQMLIFHIQDLLSALAAKHQ